MLLIGNSIVPIGFNRVVEKLISQWKVSFPVDWLDRKVLCQNSQRGRSIPGKLKKLWEDWTEMNNVLPLQEGGSEPRLERICNQGSTEQSNTSMKQSGN
jgi:hypothetical protein